MLMRHQASMQANHSCAHPAVRAGHAIPEAGAAAEGGGREPRRSPWAAGAVASARQHAVSTNSFICASRRGRGRRQPSRGRSCDRSRGAGRRRRSKLAMRMACVRIARGGTPSGAAHRGGPRADALNGLLILQTELETSYLLLRSVLGATKQSARMTRPSSSSATARSAGPEVRSSPRSLSLDEPGIMRTPLLLMLRLTFRDRFTALYIKRCRIK